MSHVVVVGASVAGVHAAEALRGAGFAGEVTLIGAEAQTPYDKPPLSKEFLAGSVRTDEIELLPRGRAAELDIRLHLGTKAMHLDTAARQVWLADDTSVHYDKVVIATGASARQPSWGGCDGVFTLRSLDDSRRLREALLEVSRVVVVGAGFIGSEVAATASSLRCRVTVVDPVPAPLSRLLGPEVAVALSDVHDRHGVEAHLGEQVVSVEGSLGDMRVELGDGRILRTDLVVAGIGALPNDGWLTSSGLQLDNGVLCDAHCRALGHDDIYAAGDVARWEHPGYERPVRYEHWTNAVEQGVYVASSIAAGSSVPYAPLSYVWSDQYDWKLQFVSRSQRFATVEQFGALAGDPPELVFAFGDEDGLFAGAATVNNARALMMSRRMLLGETDFTSAIQRLSELTIS